MTWLRFPSWRPMREPVVPSMPEVSGQSEREKALRAEVRDLARKLGEVNALVNRLEASIGGLNSAVQSYAKNLATEQLLTQILLGERDDARRELAEVSSECVVLADKVRMLETSLSGTREELRRERVERARAEQDAAERAVTIDGPGQAMAELEKRLERKDFLDEDHRHVRLMDGAEDHLS